MTCLKLYTPNSAIQTHTKHFRYVDLCVCAKETTTASHFDAKLTHKAEYLFDLMAFFCSRRELFYLHLSFGRCRLLSGQLVFLRSFI